uniref:Uncharacterized protein n=1 Tax=Glossina pallidipes TaxID=7398 RepID=A0A1A9Z2H0_GLOPL
MSDVTTVTCKTSYPQNDDKLEACRKPVKALKKKLSAINNQRKGLQRRKMMCCYQKYLQHHINIKYSTFLSSEETSQELLTINRKVHLAVQQPLRAEQHTASGGRGDIILTI